MFLCSVCVSLVLLNWTTKRCIIQFFARRIAGPVRMSRWKNCKLLSIHTFQSFFSGNYKSSSCMTGGGGELNIIREKEGLLHLTQMQQRFLWRRTSHIIVIVVHIFVVVVFVAVCWGEVKYRTARERPSCMTIIMQICVCAGESGAASPYTYACV